MNAQPRVGFCEAIKLGFKNYVNFEDRLVEVNIGTLFY